MSEEKKTLEEVLKLILTTPMWTDNFGSAFNDSDMMNEYDMKQKLRAFTDGAEKFSSLNYEFPQGARYLTAILYHLVMQVRTMQQKQKVYDAIFAAMFSDSATNGTFLEFLKYNTSLSDIDIAAIIDKIHNIHNT